MTAIGIRIEDDLASLIDALARAAGMTRSAWIRRALIGALQRRPAEVRDVPRSGTASEKLSLRLSASEVSAIDLVARQADLTRAQWLKRTIRWQLWNRAGELRLTTPNHDAILKLAVQVRAIGRSLNQAVKAMNAANQPGSAVEIQSAARSVIEMEADLAETLQMISTELASVLAGEVRYWTRGVRKTSHHDGVTHG